MEGGKGRKGKGKGAFISRWKGRREGGFFLFFLFPPLSPPPILHLFLFLSFFLSNNFRKIYKFHPRITRKHRTIQSCFMKSQIPKLSLPSFSLSSIITQLNKHKRTYVRQWTVFVRLDFRFQIWISGFRFGFGFLRGLVLVL